MQYKLLGESRIKVSKLCLGSMTWGSQNSQKDANEQIEVSLERSDRASALAAQRRK